MRKYYDDELYAYYSTNTHTYKYINISKFWKLVIGNFDGIKWVKAKAHTECDSFYSLLTIFP